MRYGHNSWSKISDPAAWKFGGLHLNGGEFYFDDFQRRGNLITFTDTNHKDGHCTVYTLRRIGPRFTRVQINIFMKKNLLMKLVFDLFMKKSTLKDIKMILTKLNEYCRSLQAQGKEHPNQIVLKERPSAV